MTTFAITAVGSAIQGNFNTGISQLKNARDTFIQPEENTLKELKYTKITDLKIQHSSYNEMIPVVYGDVRIAGNVIWATPIREQINYSTSTTQVGGKGGKKVTETTKSYSYFSNLAVGLCEGEINDIVKVYADTELLDLTKIKCRIYKGTDTQLPDTLIESIEGAGKAPAYRGIAYIVFEDFPLTEYGNRVPNFTFEIKKKPKLSQENSEQSSVEDMIKSIIMIPGSGEFVYDTKVQSIVTGGAVDGLWYEDSGRKRINENAITGKSDAVVALDDLGKTLQNIEWIAPVIGWYGDSMSITDCTITPRVEFKYDVTNDEILTTPDSWNVAGISRKNAREISKDENGDLRYGGTVSDGSLVRYLQEMKGRGYKIMFYPMMFMDVASKPWRGRLTGDYANVNSFFTGTDGYNEFILHYANLVKDYVDAFIIGTEMIGLTSITDGNGNFPAVDNFISLAAQVKAIVGSNVKITYAADWSEYHHTDGGWYNLDPLWASPNIDFIGIDAYFPLTDEGQSGITYQKIKEGWTSGEGCEWYYADEARTQKTAISPEYAWKNIEYWWKNTHTNPDSNQTAWVPQSKKIWFTEYGFSSVDGASNQPNVFYDPKSSESSLPRFSKGKVDFTNQSMCIKATEEAWQDSDMIERMFLWTWDARPYPQFPSLSEIWADGGIWKYGHWVNGKLGLSLMSTVVSDLFEKSNLDITKFSSNEIYDAVDGFVLNSNMTFMDSLETLRDAFYFDCVESNNEIKLVLRKSSVVTTIEESELLYLDKENKFEVSVFNSSDLPETVLVNYIDKADNYQAKNQRSTKESSDLNNKEIINLPIILSQYKAKNIADVYLNSLWLESSLYKFSLSLSYLYLEPSDIVNLNYIDLEGNIEILELRIIDIRMNDFGGLEVKAVKSQSSIFETSEDDEEYVEKQVDEIEHTGETLLDIIELPAISNEDLDKPKIYFAIRGKEKGWKGAVIYSSNDEGNNYSYEAETRLSTVYGTVYSQISSSATHGIFDYSSKLKVGFSGSVYDAELETISETELLNGKNIALVGNEIIQFKNVVLGSDGAYELTGLLRGLFGTESEISNHIIGERFVLIDDRLIAKEVDSYNIGLSKEYKAVSYGDDIIDSEAQEYSLLGKNLKPLAPVCINVEKDDFGNGDLIISWERHGRGYHGWRDNVDLPIIEKQEKYTLEILDSEDNVIRTINNISDNQYTYLSTNQIADFGIVQDSVNVKVYQVSDVVGQGH